MNNNQQVERQKTPTGWFLTGMGNSTKTLHAVFSQAGNRGFLKALDLVNRRTFPAIIGGVGALCAAWQAVSSGVLNVASPSAVLGFIGQSTAIGVCIGAVGAGTFGTAFWAGENVIQLVAGGLSRIFGGARGPYSEPAVAIGATLGGGMIISAALYSSFWAMELTSSAFLALAEKKYAAATVSEPSPKQNCPQPLLEAYPFKPK